MTDSALALTGHGRYEYFDSDQYKNGAAVTKYWPSTGVKSLLRKGSLTEDLRRSDVINIFIATGARPKLIPRSF